MELGPEQPENSQSLVGPKQLESLKQLLRGCGCGLRASAHLLFLPRQQLSLLASS